MTTAQNMMPDGYVTRDGSEMLDDPHNPISHSISQMKMAQRFTKLEGLRKLMDMNYFSGPSSFRRYYYSPRRVFSNLGIPKEMFFFLDVDTVFLEQLSAMVASSPKERNREILGTARSIVPSSTYCTFHQAGLGAIESGYFPLPDVFVAPSFICEETVSLFTYLAHKHQKPVVYVDCPNETDEVSENYLAEQLEQMSRRIAEQFKIKIRQERIEEVFHYSNEARKWWLRYQDIRSKIRTNASEITFQTLLLSNLQHTKYGLKETVEITKKNFLELQKKVEQEKGEPICEDVRILWMHLLPYQTSAAVALIKLLKNLKINLACDLISQITWPALDPKDPWRSLARKYMSIYGYGRLERTYDFLDELIPRFDIAGTLELSHPGCKPGSGRSPLLNMHLQKRGVPNLTFEADIIDPENFSFAQIKLRIEAFAEMLKRGKSEELLAKQLELATCNDGEAKSDCSSCSMATQSQGSPAKTAGLVQIQLPQ